MLQVLLYVSRNVVIYLHATVAVAEYFWATDHLKICPWALFVVVVVVVAAAAAVEKLATEEKIELNLDF